uniref:Uncharacterized protein n=1 Tax=Entamoeba invadens TaxID=33085 RepID=S0B1T0_ENTIV|nr:hypothetical protein [Entamoeba invadens]
MLLTLLFIIALIPSVSSVGNDVPKYYTLNKYINKALLPLQSVIKDAIGVPTIPLHPEYFHTKPTLSFDEKIPQTPSERLQYFETLLSKSFIPKFPFHPTFLGKDKVQPHPHALINSKKSNEFKETFKDAADTYSNVLLSVDRYNSYLLLYLMGVENDSFFQVVFEDAFNYEDYNLLLILGAMSEEDKVSDRTRSYISEHSHDNNEFAGVLYNTSYVYGNTTLAKSFLEAWEVKNGVEDALEILHKDMDYSDAAWFFYATLKRPVNTHTYKLIRNFVSYTKSMEALPIYIQCAKQMNIPIDEQLQIVEQVMVESYLPFFLLSDFAQELYSNGDYKSAEVIWLYLGEVGYSQCSMSAVSMLSSRKYDWILHISKYEDIVLRLISTANKNKESLALRDLNQLDGWGDAEISKLYFFINKTEQAVSYIKNAAQKGDLSSLITLAVMYQYGCYVETNKTRALNYLDDISKNSTGLAGVLLHISFTLDTLMDFVFEHYIVVILGILTLLGTKVYVKWGSPLSQY